ncbi:MAG: Glu/Leu/Phe/Val dehydrogenase [Sphingomonadales bacterium]|nr:Glu/Leu/Phe/Val dehydrogenase [Sphingomonadales bacterium]
MAIFSSDDFDNHEQVVFCNDPHTGLKAIIAVHNTNRGPAVGGCRMWNYASEEEAVRDVLRLSRGMSYKNAMAGLNLGGGKAVIIADSATQKTPEMMRSFGRFINSVGGKYITAEDVGITVEDMEQVATQTKFVAGLEQGSAGSGDPSPYTAHGVFKGLCASVKHRLKRDNLEGLKVSVQGLGHVGYDLARELHEAGAELFVTDINKDNVARAVENFGATAVGLDEIYSQDVDVFAPCALGSIINDVTIPQLKAKVIAGASNNQLEESRHDQVLRDMGILYAPDYVINAGGIMNVANEVNGKYISPADGMKAVEVIYDTLLEIFDLADEYSKPTGVIADQLALARINSGGDDGGNSVKAA